MKPRPQSNQLISDFRRQDYEKEISIVSKLPSLSYFVMAARRHQGNLPIPRSLTQSHLQSSFCHVREHIRRFRGLERGRLLGRGHCPAYNPCQPLGTGLDPRGRDHEEFMAAAPRVTTHWGETPVDTVTAQQSLTAGQAPGTAGHGEEGRVSGGQAGLRQTGCSTGSGRMDTFSRWTEERNLFPQGKGAGQSTGLHLIPSVLPRSDTLTQPPP